MPPTILHMVFLSAYHLDCSSLAMLYFVNIFIKLCAQNWTRCSEGSLMKNGEEQLFLFDVHINDLSFTVLSQQSSILLLNPKK